MRKDQSDILQNDEEHMIMPFIIEEMKSKIGTEKMVTGRQIVAALAKQMPTSERVVQKIINHIILNDIIPGLVTTAYGYYYVTTSEWELSVYMNHLEDMENEYQELREAIKRQRRSINEKPMQKIYDCPERDELTDAMHATFTISDETDMKHRVWTSMELEASGDYSLSEALEMQQVTMVDYEKYMNTYPAQPIEELTDKMHAEFTIDAETERRHAAYNVWILCGPEASLDKINEVAPMYGITGDVAASYFPSFGGL